MSGSSYYKFNEKDLDFNDPGKLSAALQKRPAGEAPDTRRSPARQSQREAQYTQNSILTHPLTSLQTTRILAVLGIDPREAGPDAGWLVSL